MVRVVTFIGALILAPTMASAQIFGGTIDAGAVQVTPGGMSASAIRRRRQAPRACAAGWSPPTRASRCAKS